MRQSFVMFFFSYFFTATLDQTVLNEMRRCTMVFFFPKKSGAARFVNTIRSISILFKFFIPILPGQKLTLGNYLQCNRRTKPDRKPKPIPAQGNYPQGYLRQKASVTATIICNYSYPHEILGMFLVCISYVKGMA